MTIDHIENSDNGRIKYVSHFKDRHGKIRWRYRKGSFTVALGTDYGSELFMLKLAAGVKGQRIQSDALGCIAPTKFPRGSLSDIIDSWYRTERFEALSNSTKRGYRHSTESIRNRCGTVMARDVTSDFVKEMISEKAQSPAAANHFRRIMCFIMDQAKQRGFVRFNVARETKRLPTSDTGYFTWTEAEIAQYYSVHPGGTLAHTAMTLMLYTGWTCHAFVPPQVLV